MDSTRLNEKARYAALRDLIKEHEMEYTILKHAHLQRLKLEHGWVDGRPEANRKRAKE
jgi:hypothetical protein